MNIILFIFACVGLTSIIIESVMLSKVRLFLKNKLSKFWYTPFECYQCMGFWSGIICSFILTLNPYMILCCGFAGSFLSPLFVNISNYLEAQTLISLEEK